MIVALPGLFSYLFFFTYLLRGFARVKLVSFPTDQSKVVLLLQVFFVCASLVLYVESVMLLFVHSL